MNGFPRTLVILLLSTLAGCCQVAPSHDVPPPAPISLEEQTHRLEAWSAQLPMLRATTVLAGVRFDYRDDKGQAHSQNAEGRLLLQRASEGTRGGNHNVLLMGSAYDQPVFEAGRNDKNWWFIIRLDTKKAWVGDATKPFDPATLRAASADSASILRADLVPQLLAMSPLPALPADSGPTGDENKNESVVMLVDDADATNHLLVVRGPVYHAASSKAQSAFVQREIIVDRITGHVSEVRLYDPAGLLVVRSTLEDYRPVTYAADATKPAGTVPQFPLKVTVTYPTQHMTIALQFEKVVVLGKVPQTAFEFSTEGLRLIPVQ